jgi:hypothetical protein
LISKKFDDYRGEDSKGMMRDTHIEYDDFGEYAETIDLIPV